MNELDTLIIGAGISGLLLGRELQSTGKKILILEKSRGVGGRLATRRIEDKGFDHGAPFLNDHRLVIDLLEKHNLSGSINKTNEGIFLTGGMTAFPKFMAAGLPIEKECKVTGLTSINGLWTVTSEDGRTFKARNVVITAPLPQALILLDSCKLDYPPMLRSVNYSKALMGLFIAQGNPEIAEISSEIHSITLMKDRNLHPDGLVVRMTPEYSDKFFEEDDEVNLRNITSSFLSSLKSAVSIRSGELKKWRYVTPHESLPSTWVEVSNNLYLAGDAFFYPDIRGAVMSAQSLGAKLS